MWFEGTARRVEEVVAEMAADEGKANIYIQDKTT